MGAGPIAAVGGLLAGVGTLVFGNGISRGASKIGSAATTIARGTDRATEAIATEVKQIRQFLIEQAWPDVNRNLEVISTEVKRMGQFLTEQAWPDVNRTLTKFEESLEYVDHFVATATDSLTITTKAVGLVLSIVAALVCKMIITKTEHGPRRNQTSALSLDKVILYFLYYVCLALAIVFALEVVVDLGFISSLGKGASTRMYIFIIPSVASLSVIFTFAKRVLNVIFTFAKGILNGIQSSTTSLLSFFVLMPVEWTCTPYSRGRRYFGGDILSPLYHIFCILIYCMLYIVMYIFYLALQMYGDFNSNSVYSVSLKILLILYVLFCTLAFAIHITFCTLVSFCFRPVWAYSVKRKQKYM